MRERIYIGLGVGIMLASVVLLGVYIFVSPLAAIYGTIITIVLLFIILILKGGAR
jgi:hypothetical protein